MLKNYNEAISFNLKLLMLKNNLNKRKLANKISVSYPTLLKLLKEPCKMRVDLLVKICNMLGVTLTDLLTAKIYN
mgnify:CR=1 FL=1|tara:strand:- start:2393 stop:2617 length:225 start_codon:yes stop_codon:yes gene_type:complete